jgi:putative peptide maturation system protein
VTDDLARGALDDTLTYLGELARDAVRPPEALARLASLRRQHPGLAVDLVWEENPYPATTHYDALLRPPGGGTISLSVCAASDTPWPLRGARLASDQDFVRVNGETLKVRDAMDCIDFLWSEARIIRPLVDLCLIEAAVKRWEIAPTAAHRQRALDAFRSSRGLLSAAETVAWMEANDLTQERLERLVRGQAQAFALRDRVASDVGLEAYWDAHPGAFDVAHMVRLRVRRRAQAEALAAEIRRGRPFHAVMDEEFSEGRLVALPHGCLETTRRRTLPPAHAEAIFAAAAGDVVGPLDGEIGFDLVRVIRIEVADFADTASRDAAGDAVFEEWLRDQHRSAKIEWFWGPAD